MGRRTRNGTGHKSAGIEVPGDPEGSACAPDVRGSPPAPLEALPGIGRVRGRSFAVDSVPHVRRYGGRGPYGGPGGGRARSRRILRTAQGVYAGDEGTPRLRSGA